MWNNSEVTHEFSSKRTGTSHTFVLLSWYLLTKLKFEYTLLGMLQTDDLGARLEQYREMSGGNYHIGVNQVLDSN